jgi:hypothetical protein
MVQITPTSAPCRNCGVIWKVGEDFAVVDHIHGAAVIAEHHLVRPLEPAAISAASGRHSAQARCSAQRRPFDPGRLEEFDAQHQRPGRDEALRAGIENSDTAPNRLLSAPKFLALQAIPSIGIVGFPFEAPG